MGKNIIETLTGAFVLIVAVWFAVIFVSKATSVSVVNDYIIKANFENIDGIEQGSSVSIGGVKVGVVLEKKLDPQSYMAVVSMAINKNIKIPEDSIIKVSSEGLLGEKFLSIIPGGEDKMLSENGELKYTHSSVNLESLLGKMIFSKTEGK